MVIIIINDFIGAIILDHTQAHEMHHHHGKRKYVHGNNTKNIFIVISSTLFH